MRIEKSEKNSILRFLLIFVCFTLTSCGYLTWLYHLTEIISAPDPDSIDFYTMVIGYLFQAAGIGVFSAVIRRYPNLLGHTTFMTSCILYILFLLPSMLSNQIGISLSCGFLANLFENVDTLTEDFKSATLYEKLFMIIMSLTVGNDGEDDFSEEDAAEIKEIRAVASKYIENTYSVAESLYALVSEESSEIEYSYEVQVKAFKKYVEETIENSNGKIEVITAPMLFEDILKNPGFFSPKLLAAIELSRTDEGAEQTDEEKSEKADEDDVHDTEEESSPFSFLEKSVAKAKTEIASGSQGDNSGGDEKTDDKESPMFGSSTDKKDGNSLEKYKAEFGSFSKGESGTNTTEKESKKTEDTYDLSDIFKKKTSVKKEDASDKNSDEEKERISELVAQVRELRGKISKIVFGQEHAINVLLSGYFHAKMSEMLENDRKRPLATFVFAGSPGVGKTLLAETAAKLMNKKTFRYDMGQYGMSWSADELFGGLGDSGRLAADIKSNPESVLIFDEIEKAHPTVIQNFLQILDAGHLKVKKTGETLSFSKSIIVFTTNAGRPLYEDGDTGNFSSVPRKTVIKALEKDINPRTGEPYFPQALCSRFASGNVVMFNRMDAGTLFRVAEAEMLRNAQNFERKTGVSMSFDSSVYTALILSEGGNVDARTARGRIENFFSEELYELLRLVESDAVSRKVSSMKEITVTTNFENADEKIKKLFVRPKNTSVLLFSDAKTKEKVSNLLGDITVFNADTVSDAIEIIKSKKIGFVLIDIKGDVTFNRLDNLNLEDVDSPARSFFMKIRESRPDVPVLLLEDKDYILDEEEKISFLRKGVLDVVNMDSNDPSFADKINELALNIYRQENIYYLAKSNKLVKFETAQKLSSDGERAEIVLFDFRLDVAIDPDESENFLGMVSMPDVTFDDVIGANDAKEELKQYLSYFANPEAYIESGMKAPKGVLLYGPPGTGKTLLAKALAAEAGVTFIATQGASFLKKYVGEGPEKVREIFRVARKYAPSIIFIDEVDSFAQTRPGDDAGRSSVLNTFLAEMDGFATNPNKPVFVLAATNYEVSGNGPRTIDAAFVRRFNRNIYVDLPRKEDRIKFLKKVTAGKKAFNLSDEKIENIALRSAGMSLALLAAVVDHSMKTAVRVGSKVVTDEIFDEAFETYSYGEEKKWSEGELRATAAHEAGHALLCWATGNVPTYLTIVARSNFGGYMLSANDEQKGSYTKDELLSRIKVSLAGRCAEQVVFGTEKGNTTGASSDLAKATKTALSIICYYGMDDEAGLAVYPYSEDNIRDEKIRARVNKLLAEQFAETKELISKYRKALDSLTDALIDKNHLSGKEITDIIETNI